MSEVPQELQDKLAGAIRKWEDPESQSAATAVEIIQFYLGHEFVSSKVFSSQHPDDFMNNASHAEGSFEDFARRSIIYRLAESIFLLRNSEGCKFIFERLKGKTLRSSYYEANSAAIILKTKCKVIFQEIRKVKGEDFDFTIVDRNGTYVSAEVTEISSNSFNIKTIKNRLSEKRRQLPVDRPGILLINFSGKWIMTHDFNFWIMEATFKFFSQTKRVNAVLYNFYRTESHTRGFIFLNEMYPFCNSSARHKMDSSFIFYDPHTTESDEIARWTISGRLGDLNVDEGHFSYLYYAKTLI